MRKTNYDILKYIYNNYWDKKILQMRYFYETSNNFFYIIIKMKRSN
jgi:hypothetical protein